MHQHIELLIFDKDFLIPNPPLTLRNSIVLGDMKTKKCHKTCIIYRCSQTKIINPICKICFTNVQSNQSELGMTYLFGRVNTQPLRVSDDDSRTAKHGHKKKK